MKIPGHRANCPASSTSSPSCFLLSQPHLSRMACQPDWGGGWGEESSNYKSLGHPGPGAPAYSRLPAPGSQESCPQPVPSPWPQNRAGCVCGAGTAPSGLTEQTQAGAPGTARPSTPASSSSGGGPGTLVPAEEDWHLVPPDISRDPHLSKHILPQQEIREQEQVVKNLSSPGPPPSLSERRLWDTGRVSSQLLVLNWEFWASGQSPLSPPELQRLLPPSSITQKPAPTLFQWLGTQAWKRAKLPCPARSCVLSHRLHPRASPAASPSQPVELGFGGTGGAGC